MEANARTSLISTRKVHDQACNYHADGRPDLLGVCSIQIQPADTTTYLYMCDAGGSTNRES